MLLPWVLALGRGPVPIDSDTAAYLDAVPTVHPDPDGDDPPDGHAGAPFSDSQARRERYLYRQPDPQAGVHPHRQPNAHADEYPDPDRDPNEYSDPDRNGHSHTDPDGNGHPHPDRNTHSDPHADCDLYPDRDADRDGDRVPIAVEYAL